MYPENWSDLGDGQFALKWRGKTAVHVQFNGDHVAITNEDGETATFALDEAKKYRGRREDDEAKIIAALSAERAAMKKR
jgi:hypothetical protein